MKKKATHPRFAFFSLQRVAMYFISWENASLPPYSLQPVALCKGVQILEFGKFFLAESGILALENHANDWNSESKFYWQKSGIQYLEPGILIKIWIQNPSSTDTDWNPVPGIRDPLRGIQNPRLYWIPLHGAEPVRFKVMLHETVRN